MKVQFAPGAFDDFDGTQEELDALIAELEEMFESMTPEKLAAQLLVVEAESKNANVSVSASIASDEMHANKNKAEHTKETSKQLLEEDEVSYVERLKVCVCVCVCCVRVFRSHMM